MRGARLAVLVSLIGSRAFAQDASSDVEIHGFVSPGFVSTSRDVDYLVPDSNKGSFEFAEAGLNFTKPIGDDLRIGLQLFTRRLGDAGNFDAKVDWFQLDYRWRDWLGVRAGRVKLPFGLYNDSSDIDAARVPVLLPQSVYPTQNRDFLLAQTGGEVYGYVPAGGFGAFDYRAYGGTITLDTEPQPGAATQVASIRVPFVTGGRILWSSPLAGVRLGYSAQFLRLEGELILPDSSRVQVELPAFLQVGSLEVPLGALHLAAEYSRWDVETRTSNAAVFPESRVTSERGYVMASYALGEWLHPGAYWSLYYPDSEHRSEPEEFQHDIAATLRFDVHANWLVKLEGHYMYGKASLSQSLNDELLGDVPEEWGVFLVKTTAHF